MCQGKRKQGFWAKGINERKGCCAEGVRQIPVRGDGGVPLPLSELGECFNKINATAGKEETGLGPS